MQAPQLIWDLGTAYDLFISLIILHDPAAFGVRAAWAAGMRSRLPTAEREFLEQAHETFHAPLHWIHHLPYPKDGRAALHALEYIPPSERLPALALSPETPPEMTALLQEVAARRDWDEADREALRAILVEHWPKKRHASAKTLADVLTWWSRPDEFGELVLDSLRAYYEVFFAEEEQRIRPALQTALEEAQELAGQLDLPALLEELSQGVRFTALPEVSELALAPSYWSDPFVFYHLVSADRMLILFGARPEDASLVPGEVVPDALLQALRALADPTRLRILRYLMDERLTPTQLAHRLRLRAPTVVHHLTALRTARLVQLTIGEEKKEVRYAARTETIQATFAALREFLECSEIEEGVSS
jgi:DNA-binding transcriptional ArsR family regulator